MWHSVEVWGGIVRSLIPHYLCGSRERTTAHEKQQWPTIIGAKRKEIMYQHGPSIRLQLYWGQQGIKKEIPLLVEIPVYQ